MPRRPSIQDLSGELAAAARSIAAVIARSGKRAWIVGGAPRDLALGRKASDVDMASAARPEEIESLFRASIPVGRAFGTLILRAEGVEVQHTTFRSEGTYTDSRHPDSVRFGASAEEDSSRRDFTCNALYLDPADDSVLDPQGGLADLGARRLRCVGTAEERFREDGLRLLRLARFAAGLDLEPDEATLAGARAARAALAGVSPERVLEELSRILAGPRARRALALLAGLDLLPGPELLELFAFLPDSPGAALGFAALFPRSGGGLEALRPSRALRQRVGEIREVARRAPEILAGSRSARVRWMRSPAFEEGAALARARALASGGDAGKLEEAIRERASLGEKGLRPAPLVTSADLSRAGVADGPHFGELLREAEDLQLEGRLSSREDALAWLARLPQDGGKTPRSR